MPDFGLAGMFGEGVPSASLLDLAAAGTGRKLGESGTPDLNRLFIGVVTEVSNGDSAGTGLPASLRGSVKVWVDELHNEFDCRVRTRHGSVDFFDPSRVYGAKEQPQAGDAVCVQFVLGMKNMGVVSGSFPSTAYDDLFLDRFGEGEPNKRIDVHPSSTWTKLNASGDMEMKFPDGTFFMVKGEDNLGELGRDLTPDHMLDGSTAAPVGREEDIPGHGLYSDLSEDREPVTLSTLAELTSLRTMVTKAEREQSDKELVNFGDAGSAWAKDVNLQGVDGTLRRVESEDSLYVFRASMPPSEATADDVRPSDRTAEGVSNGFWVKKGWKTVTITHPSGTWVRINRDGSVDMAVAGQNQYGDAMSVTYKGNVKEYVDGNYERVVTGTLKETVAGKVTRVMQDEYDLTVIKKVTETLGDAYARTVAKDVNDVATTGYKLDNLTSGGADLFTSAAMGANEVSIALGLLGAARVTDPVNPPPGPLPPPFTIASGSTKVKIG